MKKIDFGDNKYLYEENGYYYLRDAKGKIKKIPKNRFKHMQIVKTTNKHYSSESFTCVVHPSWNDKRGWEYGEV